MINYHNTLVNTLKTILPTYYEMTLTKDCQIPCISYMERDNYTKVKGDTIGYSMVSYQIKVWANSISIIQNYAMEIDNVLRELGWVRVSSGELYDKDSTMIQKIMVYETQFFENYETASNEAEN